MYLDHHLGIRFNCCGSSWLSLHPSFSLIVSTFPEHWQSPRHLQGSRQMASMSSAHEMPADEAGPLLHVPCVGFPTCTHLAYLRYANTCCPPAGQRPPRHCSLLDLPMSLTLLLATASFSFVSLPSQLPGIFFHVLETCHGPFCPLTSSPSLAALPLSSDEPVVQGSLGYLPHIACPSLHPALPELRAWHRTPLPVVLAHPAHPSLLLPWELFTAPSGLPTSLSCSGILWMMWDWVSIL